jgi:SpoVK/Ycf46/Vps4 family AAA+-type ATPase
MDHRQLLRDTEHLLAAIESLGGQDRPLVEHWTWDALILPEPTKAQLKQLQAVIEDPESARRFGIEPPTGLLLAGPPRYRQDDGRQGARRAGPLLVLSRLRR